jgi:hypothetical protein
MKEIQRRRKSGNGGGKEHRIMKSCGTTAILGNYLPMLLMHKMQYVSRQLTMVH